MCSWTVVLLLLGAQEAAAAPIVRRQFGDFFDFGDDDEDANEKSSKTKAKDKSASTTSKNNKVKTTKTNDGFSKAKGTNGTYMKNGVMYVDTGQGSGSSSTSSSGKFSNTGKAKSSGSSKSGYRGEQKAGKLPLYNIFFIFIIVFILASGFLWWRYQKKAKKIAEERQIAAQEKAEQDAWEREQAEIPDPQAEFKADQHVENLPYAPEGLFYDTTDPLALDAEDREADIADEKGRHHDHHHHHHHRDKHGHSRRHDVQSVDSGERYYVQPSSSFAQAVRSAY